MNSIMDKMLREIKRSNKSEYVLLNSRNSPFHDGIGITRAFYTARDKAGISDFRFHDLRHTAATTMVEAVVPLYTVSQILGHSDIKKTMRCAHPDQLFKQAEETLARYNSTSDTVFSSE